jgi:hypothetical protein
MSEKRIKTNPAMIKAIKAKFPNDNLMRADFSSVTTNKCKEIKGKKEDPSVYYINVEFKKLDGSFAPLYMEFAQQILCSGIKLPPKTQVEAAKYMQVTFRKMTRDEFEKSDYKPDDVSALMAANAELIEALDILAVEYRKMYETDLLKHKEKKFQWINSKNKEMSLFCQLYRKKGEKDEAEPQDPQDPQGDRIRMENPLYRVRLPLERTEAKSKRFGYTNEKTGNFQYTITDLQKMQRESAKRTDKKAPIVEIPARVMSKGQAIDLNNYNAHHFVTYMSLSNGTIKPARVTISTYGASCQLEMSKLSVWHHRKLAHEPMDPETLDESAKFGVTNTAEDVEIPLDEPKTGHVQLNEEEQRLESKQKPNDSDDELPRRLKKVVQLDSDDEEEEIARAKKARAKARAKAAEAAKVPAAKSKTSLKKPVTPVSDEEADAPDDQ